MSGDRVAEKLLSFVIMKRWSGGDANPPPEQLCVEEKVSP
jgi:hypothetical protein